MSEQGWQGFLAVEGLADWVVLHGGAIAVFRVASLVGGAGLAEAVAQISGLDTALMTLTDSQLTVRLTRGVFQLEERHVELAQAVSAVAREHGEPWPTAPWRKRCSSRSRPSRMRSTSASGGQSSGT